MKSNIVLIGMPGSGKSGIGRALARRLGYAFEDTDAMVELEAGMSITELFAQKGEAFFRDIETRCVLRSAKLRRTVIATGGGVILRSENMAALQQRGRVVYVRRSLESIAREDMQARPLLAPDPTRLQTLFAQRKALYERYGEFVIDNDDINDAVAQILEVL